MSRRASSLVLSIWATLVAVDARAAAPDPAVVPLYVPWASPPDVDGVECVFGHSAGLGFLRGYELGLNLNTLPVTVGIAGAASYGVAAIGLGISGIEPREGNPGLLWRFDFAAAARPFDTLAFGVHFMALAGNLSGDVQSSGYLALSLSTSWRPLRELSLALAFEQLNSPSYSGADGGGSASPRARLAIGVRPFGDSFSFGFEALFSPHGDSFQPTVSLRFMPVPGLSLGVTASDSVPTSSQNSLWLGFMLAVTQGRVGVDIGFEEVDSESTLSGLVRWGSWQRPSLVSTADKVVVCRIDKERRLGVLLARMDRAIRDPEVMGILVSITATPTWSEARDVRDAIGRVERAHKRVVVALGNDSPESVFVAEGAKTSLGSQALVDNGRVDRAMKSSRVAAIVHAEFGGARVIEDLERPSLGWQRWGNSGETIVVLPAHDEAAIARAIVNLRDAARDGEVVGIIVSGTTQGLDAPSMRDAIEATRKRKPVVVHLTDDDAPGGMWQAIERLSQRTGSDLDTLDVREWR